MKAIVVIADLQIPYHDPKYVKVLERFIGETAPDDVIQIGDFLDQPQPSRWNKGQAGEYADTLQRDINEGREILKRLQIAQLKMGNHDERIEQYVDRYAPALSGLDALSYENLLGLEELGVALHREPFFVAPGWMAAHGHEGGLSGIAGRTAYGLARRYDRSVVAGHTHRAGVVTETVGIGRAARQLTGMEVGHGMDLKYATYVKAPNWQQAFGILYVDGRSVQPELVAVHGGRFIHHGRVYEA